MPTKLNITDFITRSTLVHGNKYDYSQVEYVNSKTKVKIFCRRCNDYFYQLPPDHMLGKGCIVDSYVDRGKNRAKSTELFIEQSIGVYGDKYDYSKAVYKNNKIKIEIICRIHGSFWQRPNDHLSKHGCPKCGTENNSKENNSNWKGGVSKNNLNLPLYTTYAPQLEKYHKVHKVTQDGLELLGVECMYCNQVFVPSTYKVQDRIKAIVGTTGGEQNFYCSENCKKACPTYRQVSYPKGFKISTAREVQPALRKLVLARDNYQCQICDAGLEDAELHCHHMTGVEQNPIESADVDNCITLCKKCHKHVHTLPACGYAQLKCTKV